MSETSPERKEIEELLYRFAWKWVVLAHYAGRAFKSGKKLREDLVSDLSSCKAIIDSGCYSICELMAELRSIEARLFPYVVEMGSEEVGRFFDLMVKAMSGTLRREEVDLAAARPILADCTLPCVCDRRLARPEIA